VIITARRHEGQLCRSQQRTRLSARTGPGRLKLLCPDVVLAEVALIADHSPTDRPDTVGGGWAPISLYQKRYRTLFVIESVDAKTSACQLADTT
jgi:hypothetical protein